MATTHLIAPSPAEADRSGSGLDDTLALLDSVAVAGPPVLFVLVPWLLLGLMLAGPFVAAVGIALVCLAAALLVAAIGALLASPFLLIRHLRGRRVPRPRKLPTVTLSTARAWPAGA